MPTYLELASKHSILYSAFLKARTWLWEQPYYDIAEIKLFEWHLSRNIDELGRRMRDGYAFGPLVGYHIPKNLSSSRKYAYRSFLDEVASTAAVIALSNRMEGEMDRGGKVSFGNRVDRDRASDRLYIPWDISWDRFSRACGSAGRHAPHYLRTDVENFYPEISISRLEKNLREHLPRDPIFTFIKKMISIPCPLLTRGRGIPAGPATSGFIANLYLLPLDAEIKRSWKAAGRFRRYVDDMFYFAKSKRGAHQAHRSLEHLVKSKFGLRLHDERKSEIGFSHEPLGRGGSNPEWDYAEDLFDRIFGSVYHLDKTLWERFQREPDRFLKWYSRGLRWIGIYVSTDWLAQRLLTVQAKGHGSRWLGKARYYRLRFPDVELYGVEKIGMRGWADLFKERNPGFIRDLGTLHRITKRLMHQAYSNLGDVRRQSKSDLKGRVFAVRNFASRLAMMRCDRVEPIYRMLMDHPWILDPALCINAFLSMPHAFHKIEGYLSGSRPELIRAKAAWALGELGDRRAVRPLWELAKHGGKSLVARRSALEALLRLDYWNDLSPDWVYGEAHHERDAGVRKYYYLILGRMRPQGLDGFLAAASKRERDLMAALAIEFAAHETGSLYHIAGALRHVRELPSNVPMGHPGERR